MVSVALLLLTLVGPAWAGGYSSATVLSGTTGSIGGGSLAAGACTSGTATVNGATTSYPEMPFGGVKASGYGRELGGHGIKEFCNAKSVWVGPQEREGSESGSRTE